jgi:hypothetical protein
VVPHCPLHLLHHPPAPEPHTRDACSPETDDYPSSHSQPKTLTQRKLKRKTNTHKIHRKKHHITSSARLQLSSPWRKRKASPGVWSYLKTRTCHSVGGGGDRVTCHAVVGWRSGRPLLYWSIEDCPPTLPSYFRYPFTWAEVYYTELCE